MVKNIKQLFKNKKIILILAIILLVCIITFIPNGILNTIKNIIQKEDSYKISYEIRQYRKETDEYELLIIITNPEGIESVKYPSTEKILKCYGKKKVAIDYVVKDMTNYEFTIELKDGNSKKEIIQFERPRTGKGSYKKVKGVYLHTPNIEDGFEKEYTRYLNVSNEGVMQPANWLTDEEPENWYDYKNQKWANIYVESNGVESYYVWIPRYAYKLIDNERVDIKFIDVYNNYKNAETDELISWEILKEQGYQIPEAFEFGKYDEISISGYWMSKYELSDLSKYTIDYNLTASITQFNVSDFSTNTDKEIAKYTYAINGQIQNESVTLDNYSFNNAEPDRDNVINVTALDNEGRIIGSMTKKLELTEVNPPDLSGFDKDTTFYVYWDAERNEHNEIPISKEPPANWYNYTYSSWANIVSRNNGLESYYVWIPRYQYRLNETNQRVDIRFIQGLSTKTQVGYEIPEAFTTTINEEQVELDGYWISKYELSTEPVDVKLDAEIVSSSNLIRVKDIKGTLIQNLNELGTEVKIEYYLNGDKKHEGTSYTENYVYNELNQNRTYTVNIILREKLSNKYLGAITKKITTKQANVPQFNGLVEDRTYYVLYDDEGNKTIGDKIKIDGSNIPDNWYDYSKSRWANIVVTDGKIENGQIVDATTTSYFVWIPRYEYRILTDRDIQSTDNRRVEINFIEGISTETTHGYQIPEAFAWNNNETTTELLGYWISKYELSE